MAQGANCAGEVDGKKKEGWFLHRFAWKNNFYLQVFKRIPCGTANRNRQFALTLSYRQFAERW